ncbi:MAG: Cyclic pyranopterin monophosphate synthase [Syntrophaceae bacterium PtaB.Bin038]|nr:MAG: Cyclic pyranopterin monophosphate synthase [Syntrophaceae bacterium PtaB.Bin038]
MLDKYKREINYLRVSVTDRCNLRCIYCMPKEGLSLIGHDDILKYEEMLRVVRIAQKLGIVKVRVTGGEPLVRRGVTDFLAELGKTGLEDISLTTNGILLESFAGAIRRAGVCRINVSLDSLDPERYARITRGGRLSDVLRGLEEAERVGFSPIKINVVTVRGFNDDEALTFARLTLEKPYEIRLIELMPIGGEKGSDEKYVSNDELMERIARLGTLHPIERGKRERNFSGPARRFRLEGARGVIGFISPISHNFCHACNRLRLTADGGLRACLMVDGEIDLKGPMRSGCSDEELEQLILRAIVNKPLGQQKDGAADDRHRRKCVREMPTIGG